MRVQIHRNATTTGRRDFLRKVALAGAAGLTGILPARARADEGASFVQQVNHVHLYLQRYALFEEPDPGIPPGIYIDAATGRTTDEFILTPPCESFLFSRSRDDFVATESAPVKRLPYIISPPGLAGSGALPAPAAVIAAIQAALGGQVPASLIAANTQPLLVAIGQFLPTPGVIEADVDGRRFAVTRDIHFQVHVRLGFVFDPPHGTPLPSVSILIGWLTRGLVNQLIGRQVPPGVDPNELIVYNWRATMNLTTENSYIRSTASEPPPRADAFPQGLTQIRFTGSRLDEDGNYTIVGHATGVPFEAPPELLLWLFGVPALTVEFAIEESGVLLDGHGD